MKHLLLSAFLLVSILGYGQCPQGEVLLRSQVDVDQFRTQFPDCTDITSGLTISGNDIRDLTPLSHITKVQQALTIINNPNLVSLEGLENITVFSYTMPPPPAPPQTSNISIINNTLLENFDELANIVPVTANGFIALTLEVKDNQSLVNLSGFQGVNEAIAFVDITNNERLTNLSGIQNISFTLGMRLEENTALDDISAIANTTIGNSGISIQNNANLEQCAVESICNAIANNPSNVNIQNNLTSCRTFEDVEMSCEALNVHDNQADLGLTLFPNPVISILNIEVSSGVEINSVRIWSLLGQEMLVSNNSRIDTSTLATGIYFVTIQTNQGHVIKRVVKQ